MVWLLFKSHTKTIPEGSAAMSPLMQPGQEPPNKGRKYPAEVLTADEVQALIGSCSARSASGIRNRRPDRAAVPLRAEGQ